MLDRKAVCVRRFLWRKAFTEVRAKLIIDINLFLRGFTDRYFFFPSFVGFLNCFSGSLTYPVKQLFIHALLPPF